MHKAFHFTIDPFQQIQILMFYRILVQLFERRKPQAIKNFSCSHLKKHMRLSWKKQKKRKDVRRKKKKRLLQGKRKWKKERWKKEHRAKWVEAESRFGICSTKGWQRTGRLKWQHDIYHISPSENRAFAEVVYRNSVLSMTAVAV